MPARLIQGAAAAVACLPRCCRFALHALALGSPRAVADLWSRFVSTLRLTYWEQETPLPRMRLGQQQQKQQQKQQQQADGTGISGGGGSGGSGKGGGRPEAPTLNHSLLHQKLQLLDLCIHLQQQRQEHQRQEPGQAGGAANGGAEVDGQPPPSPASSTSRYYSAGGGSDASQSPGKSPRQQQRSQSKQQLATSGLASSASGVLDDREAAELEPGGRPGEASNGLEQPQGVAGVLPGGVTLQLHPARPLRVPQVQEPPAHTEDLLAERQAALQASASIGVPKGVWSGPAP
jgi:hypothetical protein